MQNLGFAFSLLPFAETIKDQRERITSLLTRHLHPFNTHPYLAAPIAGTVYHVETKETGTMETGAAASNLKNALACPYAALGDSFFWGALKPVAAVFSALIAWQHSLFAPLAFLFLFNPSHFWVRTVGFIEGYRRGKQGVDFIRRLDLPGLTDGLRKISLCGLAGLGVVVSRSIHVPFPGWRLNLLISGAFLSLLVLCYWGIRHGISQARILYLMFIISCALSF